MVVHVARTAAANGAHIATRVKVTGFRRPGEVEAVDEETGEPLLLRARHVAGAAGVWTDRLRELAGGVSRHRIVPSKGIHIFVARDRLPMDTGVLARTEKSVLFVIPWQGGWLIGDTDTPWRHGPDSPVATGADVDYLLAKTNALLAEPLTREDVHGVIAGLRPLVADAARSDTTRISRKHVVESPAPGLTTIAGGKYTTYRVMAADLIDAVAPGTRSVTRDVPLVDRDLDGADEVTYACTHEGALHLDDVLERRTRLALTAPDRGLAAAEPAAAAMAGALGWSPSARGTRSTPTAPGSPPRARRRRSATTTPRSPPTARCSPSAAWCGRDARRRARPGDVEHALRRARRRSARGRRRLGARRVLVPGARAGRAGPRGDRRLGARGDRSHGGAAGRARHRQPDRDLRGLGPRHGGGRAPGDRVAGPPHRRRLRGAARARGVGARAHRARARRHVPRHQAALGARPRRGRPRLRRRRVVAAAAARRRPRHRRRQRRPLAAVPARRRRLGRRAARPVRHPARRDAADRRLRRARRLDRGHPGARRRRRPAGLALRPALLGARDRQGHARHGRVRARPGGDHGPASAGRHPRLVPPGGARARPATRSRASSRPPPPRSTGSRASGPCRRPRSSTPCCRTAGPVPSAFPSSRAPAALSSDSTSAPPAPTSRGR